jgi:hypothetical protein
MTTEKSWLLEEMKKRGVVGPSKKFVPKMNFKQIEKQWEKDLSTLHNKFAKCIEQRVRELVAQLKNFTIQKIDMGMGVWSIHGPEFQAVYDDDSEGSKELHEIIYWIQNGNYCWNPKSITKAEESIFKELIEICDWWVDQTGGDVLTFN